MVPALACRRMNRFIEIKFTGDWFGAAVAGGELPELSGEEAAEGVAHTDGNETGAAKGVGVVRQPGWFEAGEPTEGEIERPHDEAGRQAKWAGGWDAEVGDNPKGSGGEARADGGDELGQIPFGEAVEKEVCGDEIEGGLGWAGERGEGVGVVGGEPVGGKGAAMGEEMEHDAAGIDGGSVEAGVDAKESGEESAVAVAEDEGVASLCKGGEMGGPGAREGAAEGEAFEEVIGAGDAVEVGYGGHQRGRILVSRSSGRKRTGVVRARSAAARRVRG